MFKFACQVAFLMLPFLLLLTPNAQASSVGLPGGVDLPLSGWAWSSTIGWISMSCTNSIPVGSPDPEDCSANGLVDYGVDIQTNGDVEGHAWSPNVGWIRFGSLSSFPSGTGTVSANAEVTGTYPNLTFQGWARACAGTASGDCSTMADYSGGWDGWISLGGNTYSIVMDAAGVVSAPPASQATRHWGWGSTVVGWVDFDPVVYGTPSLPPVSIDAFTATPDEVELGTGVTLAWLVTGATSCTASNNNGDAGWTGPVSSGATNNQPITPPRGTTTYELACSNGVTTVTDTVDVLALPDITIGAFSNTPGTASSSGLYDRIDFTVDVSGIPAGVSSVPYVLTYGTSSATGMIDNGSETITLFDVPYNTAGDAVLEIDTPFATGGDVAEDLPSIPGDEDVNEVSSTPALSAPDPDMTLTLSTDFIRRGGDFDLNWEIVSPYDPQNCELTGQGLPGTDSRVLISFNGGEIGSPVTETGSVEAVNVQNTSTYTLTCDKPDGTAATIERTIEVVPGFQEI